MKPARPAETRSYPVRVQAGFAVAAVLCLWGAFQYYALEANYAEQYRDPYRVADQFARFEAFSTAVPADAILGYVNDLDFGTVTADAMFQSAQYALAPRMLRKGPASDLVLGNFTRPADFVSFGRARGLRMERDFGNGVVLFRKERR